MKASKIFRQYIWLTDIIYRSGGITLQELNDYWIKTELSEGIPRRRPWPAHRCARNPKEEDRAKSSPPRCRESSF